MAKTMLFAPEGATSCSYDGVEFKVVDGLVEVPGEAVPALMAHGYATSREAAKAPGPSAEDIGAQLTALKTEAAELRGSVDAVKAERDALVEKVKKLEADLAAAGKKR